MCFPLSIYLFMTSSIELLAALISSKRVGRSAGRVTWTIYTIYYILYILYILISSKKVGRRAGRVMWTLGGSGGDRVAVVVPRRLPSSGGGAVKGGPGDAVI